MTCIENGFKLTKMLLSISLISFIFLNKINCRDYQGFDDSVLFRLDWAGDIKLPDVESCPSKVFWECPKEYPGGGFLFAPSMCWYKNLFEGDTFPPEQQMTVVSADNESYKCYLPNLEKKELKDKVQYDGPSPIELLQPLFQQTMCTFRLESYWTYEVCHGRYIRQYHEDREGKKVKTQEYFLGMWDRTEKTQILEEHKEKARKEITEPKSTKRIYGVQLPYYELTMGSGTLCDLNNKPRTTKLLYVCIPHNKQHEVYSLKEISTCEYEIIILTSLLCLHPKYKPKDTQENVISCVPLNSAPKKPRSLLAIEAESIKLRQQSKLADDKMKKVYAVFKVDKDSQGGERVRVELRPFEELEDGFAKESTEVGGETNRRPGITDTTPVENFLLGKNCLTGGSGWWKYEFCYGRYVEQYHIEKEGKRTSLNLGNFDKQTHLEWLEKNPHKRPKPLGQRKQLSHFYSGGTVCDKTGKSRQTEVKLKCLENSSSPGSVSLYLLEPKYCEYILGVESPLICDIIGKADENGLVEIPDFNQKKVVIYQTLDERQHIIELDDNEDDADTSKAEKSPIDGFK